MLYRADIDCLRAVAVLSVIGFHWDVATLQGGYVGVDVFFVISGYLITKLITQQLEAGRFSFFEFYIKRARRLLPALYAVILTTVVTGWFILLPPAMMDLWKSAISAFLFSSNFYFWQQTGYFDKPALDKPLLHTWSLGIEEQFYFVVPALLWALSRYGHGNRFKAPLTILIAALSFAACCLHTRQAPASAFYFPQDRAWEFILGASVIRLETWRAPRGLRLFASASGLACIIASAVFFSKTTAFPGPSALLPCFGTAAAIWANAQAETDLGSRFAAAGAFIGRLSYSLYLWHWPIFVFASEVEYFQHQPPLWLLAAATGLLSAASYFGLEKPVRTRRFMPSQRRFIAACVLMAATFLLVAVSTNFVPALRSRFDGDAARIANYANYPFLPLYRVSTCLLRQDQTFSDYDQRDCFNVDRSRTNVVFWGDSLSAASFPGLRFHAGAEINPLQATSGGCLPIFDADYRDLPNCRAFNDSMRHLLFANRDVVVVLFGDWSYGETNLGRAGFQAALKETVKQLSAHNIRVIVLGAALRWKYALPKMLVEASSPDPADMLDPHQFELDRDVREALPPGTPFISILSTLCPTGRCPVLAGDVPVSWDIAHLTKEGAILVIGRIWPLLLPCIRGLCSESPSGHQPAP